MNVTRIRPDPKLAMLALALLAPLPLAAHANVMHAKSFSYIRDHDETKMRNTGVTFETVPNSLRTEPDEPNVMAPPLPLPLPAPAPNGASLSQKEIRRIVRRPPDAERSTADQCDVTSTLS